MPEKDISHPEFLGCKMLGPEGAGCGAAGCWASVLIRNVQDIKEPERSIRIEEIKKEARQSGCLNSEVTSPV